MIEFDMNIFNDLLQDELIIIAPVSVIIANFLMTIFFIPMDTKNFSFKSSGN